MNEKEVYDIIHEELNNDVASGMDNDRIADRILAKIQAYITEEKHYRREKRLKRIFSYRILSSLTGVIVVYIFTGSITISLGATITADSLSVLINYVIDRVWE